MIRLQQYTPEVYYNQSRDFQFIGRLFDLVMNSVKTNADLIYNIPLTDDTDEKLIDLLAMSLGFKAKHHYSIKQLKAVCSIFPELLRNKGSIKAITLAGKALLHSEGISEEFECYFKDGVLYIFIPQELSDISLFRDLLTYILPAGIPSTIVRAASISTTAHTELTSADTINYTIADETPGSSSAKGIIIKPDDKNITTDLSTKGSFINSTVIAPIETVEPYLDKDTKQMYTKNNKKFKVQTIAKGGK